MSIGIWQVVLILMIVLIIFGAGKLPRVMGDVAKGIKSFKQGMADEDDEKYRRYDEQQRRDPRQLPRDQGRPQEPIDVTPRPSEPAASKDDDAR